MHPSIDTSTLNFEEIRKLPTCELPARYTLGSYGSGCFLDAPGFPSYMIQPIYTPRGGTPSRSNAATMVLAVEGVLRVIQQNSFGGSWEEAHARYEQLLHRIWKPLPLEHERVQMWLASVYRHFHHCYHDVERTEYGRPGTLIYPLPYYELARPKKFQVDAAASEDEMARLKDAMRADVERVAAENSLAEARAARIATPENHQAVRSIRKFYPDYQPNLEWIAEPPASTGQEDWWETAAKRPEVSECVHRNNLVPGSYSSTWAHPTKPGARCRWCGRTNPMEAPGE